VCDQAADTRSALLSLPDERKKNTTIRKEVVEKVNYCKWKIPKKAITSKNLRKLINDKMTNKKRNPRKAKEQDKRWREYAGLHSKIDNNNK
jgi:hypothetical protein